MNKFIEKKYFTKELLLEAIDAGKREKRSHIVPKELIINCENNFIFVVHNAFYHNKNEMRLFFTIDYTCSIYTIDVGMARYNSLPIAKTYADGTIRFESRSETDKKRPYGNSRFFEEKIQKKPIRKSNFRKIVIEAYGHQCALCSVTNPLVAAHIVPVANGGSDTIDNGILLCKNHDHQFEFGKIKISPKGDVTYDTDETYEVFIFRYPNNIAHYPSPDNFKRKLELITEQNNA